MIKDPPFELTNRMITDVAADLHRLAFRNQSIAHGSCRYE